MTINVYDLTNQARVHEKTIIDLLSYITKMEQATLNAVNVIIAHDAYLKDLNKRFLNKDEPTNVIAFDLHEVSEIYVSYEQCHHDNDLYYYVVHGFLHLLGYDHDTPDHDKAMDLRVSEYVEAILEK